MKAINKWIGALLMVLSLSACSNERLYQWEEEVVLSTGEHLTLDRSVKLKKVSSPGNPFESSWMWRESTITVREGPADVKGGKYEAPLLPMLLERDQATKRLMLIGINVYCFDRDRFNPAAGQRYFAFVLSPNVSAQSVAVPDWAWERRLNLLMPNEDKSPPKKVTPEFAERFNKTESRGEAHYFVINPTIKSKC